MESVIGMNRVTQAFAGQAAEIYMSLAEQTVGLQEKNVRLFRDWVEEGTRQARRQTEANLMLVQDLFEQGEEQHEALRKLTENVTRAYWGLAFSPLECYGRAGEKVAHEAVAEAPKELTFPIPDYARLNSAKVIEKLDSLSLEELKKVRAYEMEHKNRKALLATIEQRIQSAR